VVTLARRVLERYPDVVPDDESAHRPARVGISVDEPGTPSQPPADVLA